MKYRFDRGLITTEVKRCRMCGRRSRGCIGFESRKREREPEPEPGQQLLDEIAFVCQGGCEDAFRVEQALKADALAKRVGEYVRDAMKGIKLNFRRHSR